MCFYSGSTKNLFYDIKLQHISIKKLYFNLELFDEPIISKMGLLKNLFKNGKVYWTKLTKILEGYLVTFYKKKKHIF